jgi:mRNA-degrading endonuclease toxin of MazEF toxin-antitoxin module
MEVAVAGPVIRRGHVFLVRLEPPLDSEIKKTRPCVVVFS